MNLDHIKNEIHDDPRDRISKEMLKKFDTSTPFVDIHTHLFTLNDVPSKFLGIRLPMNRRFMGNTVRLLQFFKKNKSRDKLSGHSYFLSTMKDRSSEAIYRRMNKVYYQDKYPDAAFGVLTMDMSPGIKGETHNTIWTQFGIIAMVRNIYPDKIIPFACIDPRRKDSKGRDDALNLFKAAFSKNKPYNYYGLKVYPSLGYLPSHPVMMQMLEICAEKGIPVLTHCSSGSTHGSNKRGIAKGTFVHYKEKNEEYGEEKREENRAFKARRFKKKNDYRDFYNRPHHWDVVLEKFPNLKLNIAHFGGDHSWENFTNGKSDNSCWVKKIVSQMDKYPNVYADFSYTLSYPEYSKRLKTLMTEQPIVEDRVLFGSDYYMLVIENDYRTILNKFEDEMEPEIMDKIARKNNREYLGL